MPNPLPVPMARRLRRWAVSSRALRAGLCVTGAVGVFFGMLLGRHALFLGGVGIGVAGYLLVRVHLKRSLEKEEDGTPIREDE